MRHDRERLQDIFETIQLIEKYYCSEVLQQDEVLQAAMLHYLQVIGEACRALSETFQCQHQDVKWAEIIGFRHILVHHYFKIDLDLVKHVIEEDIPVLKRQIEILLQALPPENSNVGLENLNSERKTPVEDGE
jgi:uncharacterized protein with HEPN domain